MPTRCPHDSNNLSIREVEGHIGYFCESCRGAWLPSQYVKSIEYARDFSHERLKNAFAKQPKILSQRRCPGNCGPFQRIFMKGLQLDWCPKCQGIWFDRGEIETLLRHHPPRDGERKESLDAGDLTDIAESFFQVFDLLQ